MADIQSTMIEAPAKIAEGTASLAQVLDAYGPWGICAFLFLAFSAVFYFYRKDSNARILQLEGSLDDVNRWIRDQQDRAQELALLKARERNGR